MDSKSASLTNETSVLCGCGLKRTEGHECTLSSYARWESLSSSKSTFKDAFDAGYAAGMARMREMASQHCKSKGAMAIDNSREQIACFQLWHEIAHLGAAPGAERE